MSAPATAAPCADIGSIPTPRNEIIHGDCLDIMAKLPAQSVDLILTDPPYGVRYRSREGRRVLNDDHIEWVKPAFAEMYRLLKPGAFAISFYGWNNVDLFSAAWRDAGFSIVGHIVFRKRYASSSRYLRHYHESAYLLAKGLPVKPAWAVPDVIDFRYTGNRLHPTEKPVSALLPLVTSLCPEGGLVLDPFCGSGSSLVAAKQAGRDWVGIELDPRHHLTATSRLRKETRDAA